MGGVLTKLRREKPHAVTMAAASKSKMENFSIAPHPSRISLRSTLVAALLMLAANFAIGMIVATAYQLFVGELGWSVEEYTAMGGGWGLLVGGGFAAITGFLTDKVGRRRVAAIAAIALAAAWAVFGQLESLWTEPWLVYALGFYAEACQAVWSVALIVLCMDLSWPRIAASP